MNGLAPNVVSLLKRLERAGGDAFEFQPNPGRDYGTSEGAQVLNEWLSHCTWSHNEITSAGHLRLLYQHAGEFVLPSEFEPWEVLRSGNVALRICEDGKFVVEDNGTPFPMLTPAETLLDWHCFLLESSTYGANYNLDDVVTGLWVLNGVELDHGDYQTNIQGKCPIPIAPEIVVWFLESGSTLDGLCDALQSATIPGWADCITNLFSQWLSGTKFPPILAT
jgi:hypothetical protein